MNQPTISAGIPTARGEEDRRRVTPGGPHHGVGDQRREREDCGQRRAERVRVEAPRLVDGDEGRPVGPHARVQHARQEAGPDVAERTLGVDAQPAREDDHRADHRGRDRELEERHAGMDEHEEAERHTERGGGDLAAGDRPLHVLVEPAEQGHGHEEGEDRGHRHRVARAERHREQRHGDESEAETEERRHGSRGHRDRDDRDDRRGGHPSCTIRATRPSRATGPSPVRRRHRRRTTA